MQHQAFTAPKLRPKPNLLSREVDGEFVIYDPDKDAVHTLNATAHFIWEHCDNPAEIIAQTLQTQYQVSNETATRDVQNILNTLQKQGLLQEVTPL